MVIVAAGSGKMGNDSRDKKMNKDLLKVDQFATISSRLGHSRQTL
jgi:hypothetical protein